MIMFTLYTMVLYSKYNTNKHTYFLFGYVYIGVLAAILFINIGVMVFNTCKKARRKYQIKQMLKKGYVKKIEKSMV